jgi:hypothetical protein
VASFLPFHQIPLNPQVKARLPKEMERPEAVQAMHVDSEKAADLWDEVQSFLRSKIAAGHRAQNEPRWKRIWSGRLFRCL